MTWIVLYGSISDFYKFLNPFRYLCANVTDFDGVVGLSGNVPLLLYAFIPLILHSVQHVLQLDHQAKVNVRLVFIP